MQAGVIRLGIVGSGYGVQVLGAAFRNDPRVQLVAFCGRDRAKAEKGAQALGLATAFLDWRTMLDAGGLDAVAIAVPPDAQPGIALAALEGNLAVFAEKPLALSTEQARAMTQLAQSRNLANMVDFNFTEIAAFRAAHDLLRSGALGEIYHVAVTWHVESYANRNGIRSWKTDEAGGGGALSNFVSHSLHYLEWMLGPIAALFAGTAGMPGDDRQNDTFASLTLRFASGAAGGLIMSAAAYAGSGHRIEVYGKEGALVLENPGSDYMRGFGLLSARRPEALAPVTVTSTEEDRWQDGRVLPASRLARRFTDWALGGQASEPSFAAGLRVQMLLEAARQSCQAGIWVDTSVI